MKQYYVSRDKPITESIIARIVTDFQTAVLPQLRKCRDYYEGKMAITTKCFENSSRVPNRIVVNFVKSIIEQYTGYGVGIAPVIETPSAQEELDAILRYNDFDEQVVQLYENGLIFGRGAMLNFIDIDGKERFDVIDTESVIPLYSDDVEHVMVGAIRFWVSQPWDQNIEDYWVEYYSDSERRLYHSVAGYSSLTLVGAEPHHYNQCPVVIFSLDRAEHSLCGGIFSLNDGYNSILSDTIDGEDAFADAMLVLTGSFATDDDVESMKRNRVLMLDEGSTAQFLTKNSADSQAEATLNRLENKIREITKAPDFNDASFGPASGVAIRYKLIGFENKTTAYLTRFKKVIQRLVELIVSVEQLKGSEAVWRDVNIVFTRNIPVSEVDNANVVAQLRDIVSTKTLLKLLPFVDDPEQELKDIEAQRDAEMELYGTRANTEAE